MSIMTDHRPHPWRAIRAVVTKHGDNEHHVELHVTHQDDTAELPFAAWLPEELPLGAGPVPATSAPMLPPERHQVTVHRELDDDEELAAQLLHMERFVHEKADLLAEENDTRMKLLRAAARAAVDRSARRVKWVQWRFESSWSAQQLKRRRDRVRPLVGGLAVLLESGDVSQDTAARIMSLRARYLSLPDESRRLPMLTPERLAAMDAERGKVTIHAAGCDYDGCTGCVVMPDEEGGYEVQLPGVDHWVHFERSEVEFAVAVAL